jgi:hypothetical protein
MAVNTHYYNSNGDSIPARISNIKATPTDTTVTIAPKASGATTHKVTWPSTTSKYTTPQVYRFDPVHGVESSWVEEEDNDNFDYWQRVGREALHNKRPNFWQRTWDKVREIVPFKEGGKINYLNLFK